MSQTDWTIGPPPWRSSDACWVVILGRYTGAEFEQFCDRIEEDRLSAIDNMRAGLLRSLLVDAGLLPRQAAKAALSNVLRVRTNYIEWETDPLVGSLHLALYALPPVRNGGQVLVTDLSLRHDDASPRIHIRDGVRGETSKLAPAKATPIAVPCELVLPLPLEEPLTVRLGRAEAVEPFATIEGGYRSSVYEHAMILFSKQRILAEGLMSWLRLTEAGVPDESIQMSGSGRYTIFQRRRSFEAYPSKVAPGHPDTPFGQFALAIREADQLAGFDVPLVDFDPEHTQLNGRALCDWLQRAARRYSEVAEAARESTRWPT